MVPDFVLEDPGESPPSPQGVSVAASLPSAPRGTEDESLRLVVRRLRGLRLLEHENGPPFQPGDSPLAQTNVTSYVGLVQSSLFAGATQNGTKLLLITGDLVWHGLSPRLPIRDPV